MLSIYITNYRQRFVRCYTNRLLHFETITTSRNETGHAALKRQLKSSIENLKTMIDDINLMLMNEYQNHLIKFNEIRIKLFMKFRKSIFQHFVVYVISTVLRKMIPQYELLIEQSTILLFCIDVFIIFTGLACSHKMQEKLYEKNDFLLNDIHFH